MTVLDYAKTVSVDLRHYEALRLGYAVTTHKAQGLTTDTTLILTTQMQDCEVSQAQASRARQRAPQVADLQRPSGAIFAGRTFRSIGGDPEASSAAATA